MANIKPFKVNPAWRLLLLDLGLNPTDILRLANLPDDLFGREKAGLSTTEYFRLWKCIEKAADNPTLPIRIGEVISVEVFDPPIFASLCSPNLNTALKRLAQYKKLICPMKLHVEITQNSTNLELEWLEKTESPPPILVAVELVFFVQLSRIATRDRIRPISVQSPLPLEPSDTFHEYFGVKVENGPVPKIVFKAENAVQPFLTANERMWEFFEPDLQKRLSELEASATTSDRVRAALLELLPGGIASMNSVSKKLYVSSRTLQRRLQQEGQSFQTVLNSTRADLAKHYLKTSKLTGAEISFLLGFEDPNSFFRAYRSWTGVTPEQTRMALQTAN